MHYYRKGIGVTASYKKDYVSIRVQSEKIIASVLKEVLPQQDLEEALCARELLSLSAVLHGCFFHPDNPSSYIMRTREALQYYENTIVYGKHKKNRYWCSQKNKIIYFLCSHRVYFPFELYRKMEMLKFAHIRSKKNKYAD